MHGVWAVGIGGRIHLFPELMPVISGAAVVKAVEAITTVAVGKDRCVSMLVGAVEGAFRKLVLGAGADWNLSDDLNMMIRKKLIEIESGSGTALPGIPRQYS